jgi:hypothetical protein
METYYYELYHSADNRHWASISNSKGEYLDTISAQDLLRKVTMLQKSKNRTVKYMPIEELRKTGI